MVTKNDINKIRKAIDITISLKKVKGFTDKMYFEDLEKARSALRRSYYLLLGQLKK